MRLLQATADHLSGKSPEETQFEGIEGEGLEIPELLNASRLRHQKTPPPKKRVAAAKKTVIRKKLSADTVEKPASGKVNGHTPQGEVESHPVFPGFDILDTAKPKSTMQLAPTTSRKPTLATSQKVKPTKRHSRKPLGNEAANAE